MKILNIITRLDQGGSTNIVLMTSNEMLKRGHDVYILCGLTRAEDLEIAYESFPKERIINVESLKRDISVLSDLKSLLSVYKAIKLIKPDVIHTHSSKGGFVGRWSAFFYHLFQRTKNTEQRTLKIIHMPHGHVFYGYYGKFMSSVFLFLERVSTLVTDCIITLTHIEAKDYVDLKVAPIKKLCTIHNGIDLEVYNPQNSFKKPEGVPDKNGFFILCTARLEPVKGITYMINAMPFILNSYPDTTLLICGDGSEKNNLIRQSIELGIRDKVLFLGERTDIAELLSVTDVFVLPSINEGLGIVLLEAQAMGVPVVASAVGGVPEVVIDGETSILVEAKKPVLIAWAVTKLFSNKSKLLEMGKNARHWVTETIDNSERFGLKRMYDKLEELYKKGS